MADNIVQFPGVVPTIIKPLTDEEALDFVEPLEEVIKTAVSGELQAYAIIAANLDGTAYAHRWRGDCEMGRMMALLAALELAKRDLLEDIAEEVKHG